MSYFKPSQYNRKANQAKIKAYIDNASNKNTEILLYMRSIRAISDINDQDQEIWKD